MWDCPECGTKNIAESVDACPMCQETKPAAPDVSDHGAEPQVSKRRKRAQGNS